MLFKSTDSSEAFTLIVPAHKHVQGPDHVNSSEALEMHHAHVKHFNCEFLIVMGNMQPKAHAL